MNNANYANQNQKISKIVCYNGQQYHVSFTIYSGAIYIEIIPLDPLISIYTFNTNLQVEDFYNLGRCFKQCDNLEEILFFISTSSNIYIQFPYKNIVNLCICLPWCGIKNEVITIQINGVLKNNHFDLSDQLIDKYIEIKNTLFNPYLNKEKIYDNLLKIFQ
jgi:hypothetical protein